MVNENPLLRNIEGNNFEQQQNSPLNDAGFNSLSEGVTTDIRGLSRPQNHNFDIGAYEFNSTIPDSIETIPDDFRLEQNYPNPFNSSTTIRFTLPVDASVTISIYNILGEKISQISNGNLGSGVNDILFNADELTSGIYIYKVDVSGIDGTNFSSTRKMTLIR